MCFAPQRRAIFGHRNYKKWPGSVVFSTFDLEICFAPQPRVILEHRNFQNGSANVVFLCILTCKCASRHSRVPFFNSGTSKMAPRPSVFLHFHLQMCFVPQRRAILQHPNFKNGSANVVFCAFWLANVLRATAACHFSPVCQNSYLRTRRFSEATFRTSATTNHWKNTAIRGVPNILRTCTFFLVSLHACVSPFCWLDICCLLDTSTLLFNSAYCRKLDF